MRKPSVHIPGSWYVNRKPLPSDVVNVTNRFFSGTAAVIDVAKLELEVAAAQQAHDFAQKDTKGWTSIPLRSAGGKTGAEGSRAVGVHASTNGMQFKDTSAMQPYVREIVERVAADGNRQVLKVRLLKLEAGAVIPMHIDKFDGKRGVTRYHLPVVTNENVKMIVNNKSYHLAAGQLYTIDVSQAHAVENKSTQDRIHLVFDCS